MIKLADIKFRVRFEDKTEKMLTAKEIGELRDKRRYVVLDHKGKPMFAKTFRGL